jgi:hypothetical protein
MLFSRLKTKIDTEAIAALRRTIFRTAERNGSSFSAFSSFSRRFSVIRTLFASHFPVGQVQDIN